MDSIHQSGQFKASIPGQSTAELARSRTFYASSVKPIVDVVAATILLLLFIPILLISALIVRMSLGNPVIYRQPRVGKDGETFHLLKLRTMIPDRRVEGRHFEGEDRRRTHKSTDDPRVAPAGSTLRALRFDELPQLWNVIRGDMSLVGPRPELPEIVADYEDWQYARHEVKPGVTGLWQVSENVHGLMHECTEIDLEYIKDIRFTEDVKILLKTPIAMIKRNGY